MKVALLGTVISTKVAFEVLLSHGLKPEYVITLPPHLADRHSDYEDLAPLCESNDVPCFLAANVNDSEFLLELSAIDVDIIFVIGWSRLVGPEFRSLATHGVLGYHPTLLPAMRGRASIAWTIDLGVARSGGTLFWIDDGIDTGDIFAQASFDLTGDEYVADLTVLQMNALEGLIAESAEKLQRGDLARTVQDESDATYLALRRPEDGLIDWTREAGDIQRLVRAVSAPYPGAFTSAGSQRLTVWRAHVADYSNWHALVGQIFTKEEGHPVVRCGSGTSLVLTEFDLPEITLSSLGTQPVLGRNDA